MGLKKRRFFWSTNQPTDKPMYVICIKVNLFLGIAHAMALGLGPWLAVEIPDLIEKGVITYKEKTS